MRRILFRWRGIAIHSYPFMLYLGSTAGIIGASAWAERPGVNRLHLTLVMLLLVAPALVGARLLFVATNWPLFRSEPRRIWRRSDGGMSLYGGLAGVALASLPLLALFDIPLGLFWDATAVAMLIGMVFTKIGCLLNGCCEGRVTDGTMGLVLPDLRGVWRRRVPTQLLESALAVCLLIVLLSIAGRLPAPGALFFCALGGYSAGRWVLEATRETIERIGSWSLHRAISGSLVAVSVIALAVLWRS